MINSLPNYKILDLSKLKAFANVNLNVNQKFALGRVDNIVRKGENAGYHTLFSKGFFLRVVIKSGLCGKELNMKKYSLLYIKKHKECNVLIILRYT